jgi:hypothetical protein
MDAADPTPLTAGRKGDRLRAMTRTAYARFFWYGPDGAGGFVRAGDAGTQ